MSLAEVPNVELLAPQAAVAVEDQLSQGDKGVEDGIEEGHLPVHKGWLMQNRIERMYLFPPHAK